MTKIRDLDRERQKQNAKTKGVLCMLIICIVFRPYKSDIHSIITDADFNR